MSGTTTLRSLREKQFGIEKRGYKRGKEGLRMLSGLTQQSF